MRRRTCELAFLLVSSALAAACDSELGSRAGGVGATEIADGPALRLNVMGDAAAYACGTGFTEAEVMADQVDAVTGAPNRCQGSSGSYLCECDGEPKRSYAFGCVAALFEACGEVAESVDGSGELAEPPASCRGSVEGRDGECEQSDDGNYACRCAGGDAIDIAAGGDVTHASCERALFAACSTGCSDDFGACAPNAEGVLGEYECKCSTNQFTHVAQAASCEDGLLWACSPLNQAEEVCTGYGGACVATNAEQTELSCTCVDRTRHEVEHVPDAVEPRFRACRETLEATCGTGSPPEGAQCIAENAGVHARCTRGPEADASMTCECYSERGAFDTRVEELDAHSCDMATLEAICPELLD